MSSDLPKVIMFPELGPDIGVQFLFKDCQRIEAEIGTGWLEAGLDAIGKYDSRVAEVFLKAGGKKGTEPYEIDIEEAVNKVGWEAVALRLADAICWSVKRKSYVDAVMEMAEARRIMEGENPPPNRRATSSRKSGAKDTEQDFSGQLL